MLDVPSEGGKGREFTREATGIHCKGRGGGGDEKEHEKCMTMEECGCSQCGS